jgi:RimJ/RimL family protein N-acetyltransferase
MSIVIRLVEPDDASFIVELRNNQKLNKYLSPTSPNIKEQVEWIKGYKKREAKKKEFYFIVLENGEKRGLYRLYNINKFSFTIGSWLFVKCNNQHLPILTDILISDFGFESLNLATLLFDVRKENKKVIQYHALKNPFCYSEDDKNLYFLIKRENWLDSKVELFNFFGIRMESYETFKTENRFEIT